MISIRAARPEDAADIAAIYAPYALGGNVAFETATLDTRAFRQRMAAHDGRYPWLVATTGDGGSEEDGEEEAVLAFGYGAPFKDRPPYRWTVETMCYVSGAIEGQGTGRLLYTSLLRTLAAQGYMQAIATIPLPNDRQIQRHEAVGFRRAGGYREVGFKQGRWLDVGVWQRELNNADGKPAEPRSFSEIGVVRG